MRAQAGDPTSPIRVLLVGDDPRAATTLTEMLREAWPEGLLLTQAATVSDAAHELADHGDSCVLLALAGEDDGLDGLRALVALAPDAAVLVVSDDDDRPLDAAAVSAGAQDHLLRSELRPARLARAVRFARERKRAEVLLARRALEDPLTGLPNRTLFLDRLRGALDRSRRTGLAPVVMFVDVDAFKQVNDSLGHGAGDRLLCTLAERLGSLLRPMDSVARLGGDEFTLLFEGLSGREEALAIADRVREASAEPVALAPGEPAAGVSVSVGVTMLGDAGTDPEDALAAADTAMYRAKGLGGGRAEVLDLETPGTDPAGAQRARMPHRGRGGRDAGAAGDGAEEEDPFGSPAGAGEDHAGPDARTLRDALRAGEFRVHYQPRVSIEGRTGLVGFEALVRWARPGGGLLAPSAFIDVAEHDGLLVEIGDWVLRQALRDAGRWRRSRPGMTVSVNLSRGQMEDPDLLDRLAENLRDARVDPSALWLEIPAAALRAAPGRTAETLGELEELGVGLALDDVGVEPAPGRWLGTVPLEMLKVDRSLIADPPDGDAGAGEPLHRLVDLGHDLGLSLVAEGVETDRELVRIRELGFDGAQGHLFSRPVPGDSVPDLLGVD